jgi:hypothetical protein
MREPEEYKKWHIRDSINYYFTLMNQDKTIPELFKFVSLLYQKSSFIELALTSCIEELTSEDDHHILV